MGLTPTPATVQDTHTGWWYVPGRDREDCWEIDDPADLLVEDVWMRPVPPPPPEERGDVEALRRDSRGRFQRNWWWEVCPEGTAGAVEYMEVRYPPS